MQPLSTPPLNFSTIKMKYFRIFEIIIFTEHLNRKTNTTIDPKKARRGKHFIFTVYESQKLNFLLYFICKHWPRYEDETIYYKHAEPTLFIFFISQNSSLDDYVKYNSWESFFKK